MTPPDIKPEWRTDTVAHLCLAMRQTQEFSALPILADALQDAGCDDEPLLARLRGPVRRYATDAALVACALSAATAESVWWLVRFTRDNDCPHFELTFAAAAGRHEENDAGDGYTFSEIASWDSARLHFNGHDAHGDIPAEFWDHVQAVAGKPIPECDRATGFSCSC